MALAGQLADTLTRLGIAGPMTDLAHHGPVRAQRRAGTAHAYLECRAFRIKL